MKKIGIIGSGAFGTAIAQLLSDNGNDVLIYGIEKKEIDEINNFHQNSEYFGKFKLNNNIKATTIFNKVLEDKEIICLAVPVTVITNVLNKIKDFLYTNKKDIILLNLSKGIWFKKDNKIKKEDDGFLISEIIERTFEKNNKIIRNFTCVYGPTFAKSLIRRDKSCLTIAGQNEKVLKELRKVFFNKKYLNIQILKSKTIGIELAAALKNVIAISSGILSSCASSINTKAAIITKAYQEVIKIALKFGVSENTFWSYAGIGDLMLTSFSENSRNFIFGKAIVEHGNTKNALEKNKLTVEGMNTIIAFQKFIKRLKINLKEKSFFKIMQQILIENKDYQLLFSVLWN